MMYLMLEVPFRSAALAAFPAQGFALVPLAKLLERMDVFERERVASSLVHAMGPAMSGEVRVVRYPDILTGSLVSADADDVYALPPALGEGYLRATSEMLRGDESLRVEATLLAFRTQLRELKAEGQAV